ncbi:MAG TPA: potassium-transporting ATPase subunit KdpA [Methanomassiliicoccales archaeon]|nr:potassium-transporting ATPase subunit KdpA [Methanomassiliicoccales archaeon]
MTGRLRALLSIISQQARPALVLFLIMVLITGIAYPLLVTGAAQLLFPHQANGSRIEANGTLVGSELIGQPFSDPKYFWGRLSSTPGFEYNASLSSGSNLGPDNPSLQKAVQARVDALHAVDPDNNLSIPVDLVTSSASGLDPHISVAAAYYQMDRVARYRNISLESVRSLIDANTQGPQLGFMGEKVVNVLELNLALDRLQAQGGGGTYSPLQNPGSNLDSGQKTLGVRDRDWIFLIVFFAVLITLGWVIGKIIADIYDERPGRISRLTAKAESFIYRPAKVDRTKGMDWKQYSLAMLIFNALGITFLMIILMAQSYLPLNPTHASSVPADLAFNTAVSFTTNTNWQSYAGETTMSHFSQMIGLTVQNFLSAATGLAILIALIRGIHRRTTKDIGNFWVDMTRAVLILLPLSFILALFLVSQGAVQTLDGPMVGHLLQDVSMPGQTISTQQIPLGPVASQEAIKMLGTNGGGFFSTNSAHPFENPTPLTDFFEVVSFLLIPVGLCFAFGRMVKDKRQGIAIFVTMLVIMVAFLAMTIWFEQAGNPVLQGMGIDQTIGNLQPGGNMEGKEARFGIVQSCTFVVSTTSVSCGAVNTMHDSLTPMGGMMPILLMQLGEVVFGGIGSGLYGMLVFVIIAVFVAGLMIGRIPDYMGKKIGPYEMKMCAIIILIPISMTLLAVALAVMLPVGRAGVFNPGPHGFSEILYAYTSAVANNGSAFAGLSTNTPFYNISLAIAMLVGRYPVAVFTLALAGALALRKTVPPSPGTLPTHTPLFISWTIGVVVLVGALSFFCVLALGPIAEYLISGG